MKFGIIDILLMVLFLLFMIRGAKRGIVRELASLIGIIAAIELARIYYPFIAYSLLSRIILPPPVLAVVAFLLTFLLFYIIALLIGYLLHMLIAKGATGIIDKILGSLFSLAKIVVLVTFALFLLKNFGPSRNLSNRIIGSSPILSAIDSKIASPVTKSWIKKSIKHLKRIKNVLHS